MKILATEGETSAVTGVDAGDQLVTDGFDKLQNGSKVVHRKDASGDAKGAPDKGTVPDKGGAPAKSG